MVNYEMDVLERSTKGNYWKHYSELWVHSSKSCLLATFIDKMVVVEKKVGLMWNFANGCLN